MTLFCHRSRTLTDPLGAFGLPMVRACGRSLAENKGAYVISSVEILGKAARDGGAYVTSSVENRPRDMTDLTPGLVWRWREMGEGEMGVGRMLSNKDKTLQASKTTSVEKPFGDTRTHAMTYLMPCLVWRWGRWGRWGWCKAGMAFHDVFTHIQ